MLRYSCGRRLTCLLSLVVAAVRKTAPSRSVPPDAAAGWAELWAAFAVAGLAGALSWTIIRTVISSGFLLIIIVIPRMAVA